MNYALANEIYGREPWAIASYAIQPLLDSFRAGRYDKNAKFNNLSLISALSGEVVAEGGSSDVKKGKMISETNINGVITKTGGESSYGMKQLSAKLLNAESDPNVIGHLFVFDTPGGSVAGMNYMAGTVGQLKKPKVGLVERDGIAGSAGYGILAAMDYIIAESGDSEVGSIGIINGVVGHANGSTDGDGAKHFIVYATKSVDKNKAEEMAINEDDTTLLQANADKANEKFHAFVKSKRANIREDQLTGKMYPASEVLGTMVDAIGSKMDAITKIVSLSNENKNSTNNKNNKTAMTASEFKAQHPEAYAEIFGAGQKAGATAESERTKVWLTHIGTDPKAVVEGIKGGGEISASQREEFLVKASSAVKLTALATDSAAPTATPESDGKDKSLTEAQLFYAKVKEELK
jgi:ClpP class serine protease